MASTKYWLAGTDGDWLARSHWSGHSVPGRRDTAVLPSGSGGFGYTVTVGGGEHVAVNTLNIAAVNADGGPITLSIDGAMTIGTLQYDPATVLGSNVVVDQGGSLTLNRAVVNSSVTDETIDLIGGTLNLGSKNADQPNLTVDFHDTPGGVLNLAFRNTSHINTTIVGFTDGDALLLPNVDLTGATSSYDGSVLSITRGGTQLFSANLPGLPDTTQFGLDGGTVSTACFAEGTHILTPDGERRVECLRPGELVTTLCDGVPVARPARWIGHRAFDLAGYPAPGRVAPIRIQASAVAENVPHRDLLVSPDHAIFIDGVLICARQLVNDMTIVRETGLASVTYYHVELDTHAILLADGLPAESYLDTGNRGYFANADGAVMLHPDLTEDGDLPTREAGSVAPFVWDAARVRPVWEALAARAAALGRARPQPGLSSDAELRLVAGDRVLKPVPAGDGSLSFVVPANVSRVRLLSRAAAPTAARPWLEDSRILGVLVKRITLEAPQSGESWDIPLDHPALADGWHDVERDGAAQCRWTNGDAVLLLPRTGRPVLLRVRADNGGMSYVIDERRRAA